MLDELKAKCKGSARSRMIGFTIAILVLLLAPLMAPINYLLGPKDLTGKTDLNYGDLEGKYVSLDVSYVFSPYLEEYSYNKTTNRRESTNWYAYVVYNYEDNSVLGVHVKAADGSAMDAINDATVDYVNEGTPVTKSFKAKGTLRAMGEDDVRYFDEVVDELESYGLSGIKDIAAYYYIDYASVNYIPTGLIWVIYGLCVIFLIVVLVAVKQLTGAAGGKALQKFLDTHPGIYEESISGDMASAAQIGKNMYVGTRFTVWKTGANINVIENAKLVWGFYYRQTGKNAVSQLRVYDLEKNLTMINLSEQQAQQALQIYLNTQPQMVIGYTMEIQNLFVKNYQEFLQIAYNKPSEAPTEYEQAPSTEETF